MDRLLGNPHQLNKSRFSGSLFTLITIVIEYDIKPIIHFAYSLSNVINLTVFKENIKYTRIRKYSEKKQMTRKIVIDPFLLCIP